MKCIVSEANNCSFIYNYFKANNDDDGETNNNNQKRQCI